MKKKVFNKESSKEIVSQFKELFTFELSNGDKLSGVIGYFDYGSNFNDYDLTILTAYGMVEIMQSELKPYQLDNYLQWIGMTRTSEQSLSVEIDTDRVYGSHLKITKETIQALECLYTPFVRVVSWSFERFSGVMIFDFTFTESNGFAQWLA